MLERPSYPRLVFVDYLRFAAVLVMLQGHTFDALLQPATKILYHYKLFNLFHGLTAPMFLFSAGFAFAVSSIRHIDQYITYSPKLEKRFLRYFSLLIIGYVLHLPYFSIHKIIQTTSSLEFEQLWNVDTLQCIGISLIFLQLMIFFLKDERRYLAATSILVIIAIFLAPIMWNVPRVHWLHPALVSYFNGEYGSFFPLFPWFGYIGAGSVVGQLFLLATKAKQPERFVLLMMITGAGMILGGLILTKIDISIYPIHDWYKTNPLYSLIRLGIIMLFCGILWYGEQHSRMHLHENTKKKIRPLQMLGRESLMIYVAHLIVLYGSPFNNGAGYFIGTTLNFWQSALSFGILFLVMLLFSNIWYIVKKRYPAHARFGLFTIAVSIGMLFLTRRY
jgi:uncharacterized membrane protein